jgi:hypothetical protein
MQRWKLRLCAIHAATIQEDLAQYKVLPEDAATGLLNGTPTECLSCNEPVDHLGVQLFVTGYPANDQREDYWANIHETCSLPAWFMENMA